MKEIKGHGGLPPWGRTLALLATLGPLLGTSAVIGQTNTLRVSAIQSNGWLRISGVESNYSRITVEASSNLVHWQTIAVLHDSSFEFADPVSAAMPFRFYRYRSEEFDLDFVAYDWKNQIKPPSDQFMDMNIGRWVKFAILMDDPTRVYYAHGPSYLFHYDFATARLGPFIGMDEPTFDQLSLFNVGRKVMLGAVLFPRNEDIPEYAVQFVSQDPLPRELVRDFMELVSSTVITETPSRAFYMPTFEQFVAVAADREWYATNGVTLSSPERWATANSCYSQGWAIGTLKFFTAAEVDAAYADGRLLPQDILLTDGVPAELPYVSGIITFSPTTDNSHVVILAQSYGVPMVYFWDQADRARVLALVGREIVLIDSVVFSLDPAITAELKAELLAAKTPAIRITPVSDYGAYTAPTDSLYPTDVRYFGGKASNYGLLRRTVPSNAPPAIAISFDLWTEFMAQTLGTGRTLREEISNRLAGLTYPAHISAIKAALPGIRDLIRQNTDFSPAQREAITGALRVFDSRRNIRFRSSTNVEDTENFTGAGLYDSYSGCLDDDLDSDNRGPSHCDPTEDDERGVFRAIRRVYASFYNDNAYLERLRHGVNENDVGMAILVHHSIPDGIEMANGVATVNVAAPDEIPMLRAHLVSQLGAVPVANPDQSSWPENVIAERETLADDITVSLSQSSSLVPLGEHVMEWDDDYRNLAGMLFLVTRAYQQMTAKEGPFTLDFEYKKVEPGWLEVKQVREVPNFETAPQTPVPAFLLNQRVTFVPYQGYNEDGPFPNHRLKSRWTLQTKNCRLTETNLTSSPYTELTIEHISGDRIETLSGPIETFPNYSNIVSLTQRWDNLVFKSVDSWRMGSGEGPIEVQLETQFSVLTDPHDLIRTGANNWLSLTAKYDHPVLYNRHGVGLVTRTKDVILLKLEPHATPEDYVVNSRFIFAAENTTVTITTSYIHGPSMVYGLRTRIEGMTTQPIELTNYFSQTVDLGHMAAGAQFLFEPRLEPGISPGIASELESRDIRLFYLRQPYLTPILYLRGRDGTIRTFAWGRRG